MALQLEGFQEDISRQHFGRVIRSALGQHEYEGKGLQRADDAQAESGQMHVAQHRHYDVLNALPRAGAVDFGLRLALPATSLASRPHTSASRSRSTARR